MDISTTTSSLAVFQTTYFYFDGFEPNPIESCLTDSNGEFSMPNTKRSAKIFAKLVQDKSGVFWLVDLPADGRKLILNNENIFKIEDIKN
jgi:hypothetical protein